MTKLLCTGCKERFTKEQMIKLPGGRFHSYDCAIIYASEKQKKQRIKKDKQLHAKAKRELKDNDKSFQIKKTQEIFNKYIRVRDADRPCCSCSRHHAGQYHAGHYKSVGAHPELRFDERNCYKQCSACNNKLSGNIINYRINLVKRFGEEFISELEGPHKQKKYTLDELKKLQKEFTQKTKDLEYVRSNFKTI